MTVAIIFNAVISVVLLVTASVMLLTGLLYLEWRRKFRFRIARMAAQVIMVLSLLIILLKPSRESMQNHAGTILLTKGYDIKKIDSIVAEYPDIEILRTPDASSYPSSKSIPSYHAVSSPDHSIKFIAGEGIPLYALDMMSGQHFDYLPGKARTALVNLHAPSELTMSATGVITGELTNNSQTKIRLEGPTGQEDSVEVAGKSFTLSFHPRHIGRFLYRLRASDAEGNTLFEEKLPVTVVAERKLNVAVFQEYPSVEIRYLKNFLSEKGHAVTVRSRLSRSQYHFEFANTPKKEVNRITTVWLDGIDLLVVDSDAFQNLSSVERTFLLDAIRNGLGVLFLFNAPPSKVKGISTFLPFTFSQATRDTVNIYISGKRYNFPVTPETIGRRTEVVPVMESTRGELTTGYVHHGRGKAGFQLLNETYRLVLEGKPEPYAAMWSDIVGKTARSYKQNFSITILTPGPIHLGEPVDVEVVSNGATPELLADSIAIPLIEDVMLDDRWTGRTWFEKAGWHQLHIPGDSAQRDIYVHPGSVASSWELAVQRDQNYLKAMSSIGEAPVNRMKNMVEVSLWPFFLLFLLAGGFLWLAPKL